LTAPDPKIPRLALSPDEAAEAIGCSRDFFDEHVKPELRMVRRGRRRFVPVSELERWLTEEATSALEDVA
jgi:excisionase family DNA binding protein